MKFAIVNVNDLPEMSIVCDITRNDKELIFMFDNKKIYSLDDGGTLREPLVTVNEYNKVFDDIDNGTIKAKIITLAISVSDTNKPVSILDPYLNNNKFMYNMLLKLYGLPSITSVSFAAILRIDKRICRMLINEYLIPSDLVTPYHTTYKVLDSNKMNIKEALVLYDDI